MIDLRACGVGHREDGFEFHEHVSTSAHETVERLDPHEWQWPRGRMPYEARCCSREVLLPIDGQPSLARLRPKESVMLKPRGHDGGRTLPYSEAQVATNWLGEHVPPSS